MQLSNKDNQKQKNRKVLFHCFGANNFKDKTVFLDKNGKAEISYIAEKPGYYRVTCPQFNLTAGAVVNPYKIFPARPMPNDFNTYWDELIAQLDKTPLKPKLTQVKKGDKKFLFYDLQLSCPISKAPVSGYFTRPKTATRRSLPAVLTVQGAGVTTAYMLTLPNAISLNINAHGLPNNKGKAYYENLKKTTLKKYIYFGMQSRDTVYFRDMALRVYRALQYLKSRPEWNQKDLIILGGSQGGLQALMGAGLDRQVTAAAISYAAGCDHGASSIGRESGWPRYSSTKQYKASPKKCAEAVDYIDGTNFARRIKAAKILMTTGTIDTVCVPSSVCAAFNVIPSKNKQLKIYLNMGHSNIPQAAKDTKNFQDKVIYPKKK